MARKLKSKKKARGVVKKAKKPNIVRGVFTGENVYSNKKEAFTLHSQSRFGEEKEGKIFYSLAEALYLLDKGKIEIAEGKKKINFLQFIEKLKENDKRIETKYTVFKELRDRGYIVKTALKFGAEFRVYDKGKKPGEEHAKWIVYPVRENDSLTWHDFSAKNRVAHSTRKNLLIGIVDEEKDVTFYEIRWVRP